MQPHGSAWGGRGPPVLCGARRRAALRRRGLPKGRTLRRLPLLRQPRRRAALREGGLQQERAVGAQPLLHSTRGRQALPVAGVCEECGEWWQRHPLHQARRRCARLRRPRCDACAAMTPALHARNMTAPRGPMALPNCVRRPLIRRDSLPPCSALSPLARRSPLAPALSRFFRAPALSVRHLQGVGAPHLPAQRALSPALTSASPTAAESAASGRGV